MQRKRFSFRLALVGTVFATIVLLIGSEASAQQETVLYKFGAPSKDGANPYAGLIFDAAGNLYGTTAYGGTGVCSSAVLTGCGTVFELSPKAGGGWTGKVLHNFQNNGKDGMQPIAGLAFDTAGNLYGTTAYGGTGVCSSQPPTGCGTVFELNPQLGGGWAEKVVHSFDGVTDGEVPEGGLIFDVTGNLYGTTFGNAGLCTHGSGDCGVVFELTSHAGGLWTEKVLHQFSNNGLDGYAPYGNLLFDAAGNLFGGTYWGGTYNDGAVFELTPKEHSAWTEQVPYSFYWGKGISGGGPGGLIADAAGNFYGTTSLGGNTYSGAVFELTPAAGGSWTQTTLYNFDIYHTGAVTNASLLRDAAGNLYGTNQFGGAGAVVCLEFGGGTESASCGTVFELTPGSGGIWTQKTLHSFGSGTDGQVPYAGLILDSAGNLYGTTTAGGSSGGGIVFEIKH
jgi:uncharacterized repeat protein (TIGR03803 family)